MNLLLVNPFLLCRLFAGLTSNADSAEGGAAECAFVVDSL